MTIDEEEYRSLIAARNERDELEGAMVKLTDGLVRIQAILEDVLEGWVWPWPPATHAKGKVKQAVKLTEELQV